MEISYDKYNKYQRDLEVLTQLNKDYLASDQNGDVQRYDQMLAEDFTASLPDLLLRDKKQFLEMRTDPGRLPN